MKKTLNWLYENWMKGTPFLALYTFILIWLYVKDANYPLFLIWLQCSAYWLHYRVNQQVQVCCKVRHNV